MPRFSVILPVYNVRAHLQECVDSLLTQSFADFEILAVDDCSPDGSGEILDDYAGADPRVRVLHLPQNVGLGPARDAGIAAATGDYLLFVDSDDVVATGSLQAIHDRLAETDDPDVLVFDYARLYWWNELVRNKLSALLTAAGPDVFTIRERPELLDLLMVVWNKAYRRDFIDRGGFRFPSGYYEDTPWTYPTLLAAERIAVLPRVCVHYRQRRGGNILRSRSRKHFDIFRQWDLVLEFLAEHPELEDWRPFLMRRELEHVVTILDNPRRLPKSARRQFFRTAHKHYRTNRPAGEIDLRGSRTATRVRLVMRGRMLPYEALLRLMRLRQRVTRAWSRFAALLGIVLRKARTAALLLYYRIQLRRPIDPNLAVYSAFWYRGVLDNPAAIYWKAKELAPHVRGVWVVRDPKDAVLPDGVEWVCLNTAAYYRAIGRAKFLINNTNFADLVRKRPGALYLQTQHGTPLKKMGLDLQDYPVGANRMDFVRLLRRIDRWDFNLSTNRFSTLIWERCNPAGYETLEIGYPRNDLLVNATAARREELRSRLGLLPTQRAVLYAPTFRDYRNSFTPEFDYGQLVDALGPDGVLLVRAHYFYDDETDGDLPTLVESGRLHDVSMYPSTEELCVASDALLTDYSSIMFDYALLDRPIVLYAYDWDTYVRTRGVNFDLMAEPPGPVATTAEELLDLFRDGEPWDEQSGKLRAAFRSRFCEFDDGRASERVVRRLFLGETPDREGAT